MAFELPDNTTVEGEVYTTYVIITSPDEVTVEVNKVKYEGYYFTPPVLPKNAKIQEIYLEGSIQCMGSGTLRGVKAISINDNYIERDFTTNNRIRIDMAPEIKIGTISIAWYTSSSERIYRLIFNSRLYIKYTLIPIEEKLTISNIHINENSLSNLCLGNTNVKKVYLNNNLIHQSIPEDDIIASYRALSPKKILLATLDEYNVSGYIDKDVSNLVLYKDHLYTLVFESDGYEYQLPSAIEGDNTITYDYYDGSSWFGSNEVRLIYNTSTGITNVFISCTYTEVSADIYLLDYTEATASGSYILPIDGAAENCSTVVKNEVTYLYRNSQNYSPISISNTALVSSYLKNVYKISDSITSMQNAFNNCVNLENAICGVNVTNMDRAFFNCRKLGSTVYCEEKVTSMVETFAYSFTEYSAYMYLMSPNITNMYKCIQNKISDTYMYIYVPRNSTTLTSCIATDRSKSLTGTELTFTYNSSSDYYENDAYKIRVYPIDNVREAYNNRMGNQ